MDPEEIEQTIREYLPQVIHMSLATVADGRPWVCEVHVAFDDDLNLYWVSWPGARHSQEVAANPRVSGSVVKQHDVEDLARGVSFEGTAEMIEELDENSPEFKVYTSRFPDRAEKLKEAYETREDPPRRMYKISVSDYYLIDAQLTGRPEKYHLPWSR